MTDFSETAGGDHTLAALNEVMAPFNGNDLVEAFADRELVDAMRAGLERIADPDMVTEMVGAESGLTGTFSGPDGFIEGWQDFLDTFAVFHNETEDMIVGEDGTVLVLSRQRATTATGGVEIENEAAAVFWFEGGRLVKAAFHLDRGGAAHAAGIDPGRMHPRTN